MMSMSLWPSFCSTLGFEGLTLFMDQLTSGCTMAVIYLPCRWMRNTQSGLAASPLCRCQPRGLCSPT